MRESVLEKTTRCAEDDGEISGFFIVVQSGEGDAKSHRARQTPKKAAHRDVDYGILYLRIIAAKNRRF
jgi:hypothetical protein